MKNRKSVLGINFRYLAFKYKIKSNYWQEDWKHIERCIFTYAETTRSDSDYYVGNTVRELCLTRSADFILDTAELNLLIHHTPSLYFIVITVFNYELHCLLIWFNCISF